MTLIEKVKRAILGYDFFISYSRKDSLDYAYKLSEYFIKRGYRCYIDLLSSTGPGEKISDDIIKAIKRSNGLVLIGSAGAQLSEDNDPISQEIDTFLHFNSRRFLIPINVDAAIDVDRAKRPDGHATSIEKKILGLAVVAESRDHLENKRPGQEVTERIENTLKFTKKSASLRRAAVGTAVFIATLIIIGAGLTIYLRGIAKDAKARATTANTLADAAEKKYTASSLSLIQAKGQLKVSEGAIATAKDEIESANRELKVIQVEKDSTEQLVKENRALAEEYKKLSFARNLAAEAKLEAPDHPQSAALKSLYALNQFADQPRTDPLVEKVFRNLAASQKGIELGSNGQPVSAVCISDDASMTAVADKGGGIRIFSVPDRWHANPRLFIHETGHTEDKVRSLSFNKTHDCLMAVMSQDNLPGKDVLKVFRIDPLKKAYTLLLEKDCLVSGLSADLSLLAFANTDSTIIVYPFNEHMRNEPVSSLERKPEGHVIVLKFNDDHTKLVAGLDNALVEFWDIARQGKPVRVMDTHHRTNGDFSDDSVAEVGTLCFSPDSRLLLTGTNRFLSNGTDDTLKVWKLNDSLSKPDVFVNKEYTVDAWLDDHTLSTFNLDGKISTWDLNAPAKPPVTDSVREDEFNTNGMEAGRFSPDGSKIIMGDKAGKVYFLTKEEGHYRLQHTFFDNTDEITALGLSHDGSCLVAGTSEGSAKLFHLNGQGDIGSYEIGSERNGKLDVVSSGDGKHVIVSDHAYASFWDISSYDHPQVLAKRKIVEDSIYFRNKMSRDGKWALIREDTSKAASLYHLAGNTCSKFASIPFESSYDVDFSAGSKHLIRGDTAGTTLYMLDERSDTLMSSHANSSAWRPTFSQQEHWILFQHYGEGADLYFINDRMGTDAREVKEIKDSVVVSKFISDSLLTCITKNTGGNYYYIRFFHLDEKGGITREDSMFTKEGYDSLVVSEDHRRIFVYDTHKKDTDPFFYEDNAPRLLNYRHGFTGSGAFYFPGNLLVNNAIFSHNGKYLMLSGNSEKNEYQLWKIEADSMKFISKVFGPFTGSGTRWDYEFSTNDKYLVFYSGFSEAPYIIPIDRLPSDPVAVSLQNGNGSVKEISFSGSGDSLYVINSSSRGFSAIVGPAKMSVNLFRLRHPEEPPSEIFNSPALEGLGFQAMDDFTHFFIWSDKKALCFLTDLHSIKEKVARTINRNFTWNEWRGIGKEEDYSRVFDSLPAAHSLYDYLYDEVSNYYLAGDKARFNVYAARLNKWIMSSNNAELCNDLSLLYRYHLHQYAYAVNASNRALSLEPDNGYYKVNRGLARWLQGKFQDADRDISDYLDWYKHRYKGSDYKDVTVDMEGYLPKIRARQKP